MAIIYLCQAYKEVGIVFCCWPALSIIYHFLSLLLFPTVPSNPTHFLQVMPVLSLNIVLHILKYIQLVRRPQIEKDIDIKKEQCSTENNPPEQRFGSVQYLSVWQVDDTRNLCYHSTWIPLGYESSQLFCKGEQCWCLFCRPITETARVRFLDVLNSSKCRSFSWGVLGIIFQLPTPSSNVVPD